MGQETNYKGVCIFNMQKKGLVCFLFFWFYWKGTEKFSLPFLRTLFRGVNFTQKLSCNLWLTCEPMVLWGCPLSEIMYTYMATISSIKSFCNCNYAWSNENVFATPAISQVRYMTMQLQETVTGVSHKTFLFPVTNTFFWQLKMKHAINTWNLIVVALW